MRRTLSLLTMFLAIAIISTANVVLADQSSGEAKEASSAVDDEVADESQSEGDEDKAAAAASHDDKTDADDTEAAAEDGAAKDGESARPSGSSDDQPAAKKDSAEAKQRKTYIVKPKRMKVEIELDGTFVAKDMEEVALRPEVWTDYEIVEIVPHGAKVHAGQTLIKFDARKINQAIDDLELEQRLSEIAIRREEEELPRLERTLELNLEEAERSEKNAREDFDRYNEIERPMAVKSANFMVKYYQSMLDYEKDELDQLVKMYKADDLTEETEEVVLKRQRNSVEFAEFNLEESKLSRDETLNVRLPRFDIQIREALERADLALERAKLASALDRSRARYELEQKKEARTKSLDRHAKMLGDRDLMEIKAPSDGVVYYGQCVSGKWSDTSSQIAKLRAKSNVAPGTVMMTIVNPRPVYVTANFDEDKLPELQVGQAAQIIPPGPSSKAIGGKVREISPVPVATGKFEINLELDEDELPAWIVAGIGAKAKVTTYDKRDTLAVPKKAVHIDEDNENQHYVWLIDSKDEPAKAVRRDVEVGKRSDDEYEIVKGLKAGDAISLDDEKKNDKE